MYDNPAYVILRPFAYIFLQLGEMGQKHEVKQCGHNAAGGWYAVSVRYWAIHLFPGVGRLLVNLVPMFEKKKKKKTCKRAGQCAAMSSFKVIKMAF